MGHIIQPGELLRRLGENFRHIKAEHQRESPHGATRRRLEADMSEIAGSLLDPRPVGARRGAPRTLAGVSPRTRNRRRIPMIAPPPLFVGTTEANVRLEVRPNPTDGYDILADGARIDHGGVHWRVNADMIGVTRIGDFVCIEIFEASGEAIWALGDFLTGRGQPPWRWARELVEDGLVDSEFALTARGKRCLQPPPISPEPRERNICILIADAARARVFVVETETVGTDNLLRRLVEVAGITNPALRARDAEALSESRPGLRREGAPRSGRVMRSAIIREARRREAERRFAARIAEEAAGVWRRYPNSELVIAASPVMLGLLRPAIERQGRAGDMSRNPRARARSHEARTGDGARHPRRGRTHPATRTRVGARAATRGPNNGYAEVVRSIAEQSRYGTPSARPG